MLIYNVTVKVDLSIHELWLKWLQDIYIPEILGTGCFVKHQLLHLLELDDQEGITYAIQYYAESKANYNRYVSLYQQGFLQQEKSAWGNKTVHFATIMEVVN